MPDEEMIERCAKALWDEDQIMRTKFDFSNSILFGMNGPISWNHINSVHVIPEIAKEYRDKALAVIKAMREPTEKMLKADGVHPSCHTCGGHKEGYKNMIGAILGLCVDEGCPQHGTEHVCK